MEREEYEVTIRRIETCRVRVVAASEADAVEAALRAESSGSVVNHAYSDERVEVEKVVRSARIGTKPNP